MMGRVSTLKVYKRREGPRWSKKKKKIKEKRKKRKKRKIQKSKEAYLQGRIYFDWQGYL